MENLHPPPCFVAFLMSGYLVADSSQLWTDWPLFYFQVIWSQNDWLEKPFHLLGQFVGEGSCWTWGGLADFFCIFGGYFSFFFPDFGSERITIFRLQGLLCPEFCILFNIFRDRMFLPQIITPLVHYYLGMIVFFEFSWFSLSLHWLFEDLHVHTHTFFLYELPNSCTPFGAILLVQEALLELKLPEKRKNSGSDCRFPNIKSSFFFVCLLSDMGDITSDKR